MKIRIFIIISFLILTLIGVFLFYSVDKNEYLRDIEKVYNYLNNENNEHTLITFSKKVDSQEETQNIINYDDNPQKFRTCIDVLNFVSNYSYNNKQIVNKLSNNTFCISFTVQMETDNKNIYKLPIFFDKEFSCFGIPRSYSNSEYSNIIFYKLNDEKIRQIAKDFFRWTVKKRYMLLLNFYTYKLLLLFF